MSVYIWLPVVFLSVIVLWVTLYAYGKKRSLHQQVRRRNVTYMQSSHVNGTNRINTQIYTIPTQQLVVQPVQETQTNAYNNNNRMRTTEAPPSYDQAINDASAPDLTTYKY